MVVKDMTRKSKEDGDSSSLDAMGKALHRHLGHTHSSFIKSRPKGPMVTVPIDKGFKANKQGIRSTLEIASSHPNSEFFYLRENEIEEFTSPHQLLNLKILDLSLNLIRSPSEWSLVMPNLKHLYLTGNQLTSLHGFANLNDLETLAISSNCIRSFEGLDGLPQLRVLSLNSNQIASFEHFPLLPALYALNLHGNPITSLPEYRKLAIAVCNLSIKKLDGQEVGDTEADLADKYRGKVVYCLLEGFVPQTTEFEAEASKFLVERQCQNSVGKDLLLHGIQLSSEGNGHEEGEPISLHVCMQDLRPLAVRRKKVLFSKWLFPVAFKVSGDATEVFVVGSINHWQAPIPLERSDSDPKGGVFFQTTLYLPAGDYEYRYLVDGVEKISELTKMTSKYKQGMCNVYKVVPSCLVDEEEDQHQNILHIRWLRNTQPNQHDLIEGANELTYTPAAEDVGHPLRAEVLAYVGGDFHCMVFDTTGPIVPGMPKITELNICGKVCEGETLRPEWTYSGGDEGKTEIRWYRLLHDNTAVPLAIATPTQGYTLTAEDIGCRIQLEAVPIRHDWVTGRPVQVTSEVVIAGVPVCTHLDVVGRYVEDEPLHAEVSYAGGKEGASVLQWLRETADTTPEGEPLFVPIEGETRPTYVLGSADVGWRVAVDYTPVSSEGQEGDTNRFVTEPIEAGLPMFTGLEIRGAPAEGEPLEVAVDYFGGQPGAHAVQWIRVNAKRKQLEDVGERGAWQYTPTAQDVGCALRVTLVPVRSDGVHGEQRSVQTAHVEGRAPSASNVRLECEAFEFGETVQVVADYTGGLEGNSLVQWFRSTGPAPDSPCLPIQKDSLCERTHMISLDDCSRYLTAQYTPVRSDGVMGTPVRAVSPLVSAPPAEPILTLGHPSPLRPEDVITVEVADAQAGTVQRWIRVDPTGQQTVLWSRPKDDTDPPAPYTVTDQDVGCRVMYSLKCPTLKRQYYSPLTPAVKPALELPSVVLPERATVGIPLMPSITGGSIDYGDIIVGWSRYTASVDDTELLCRTLAYTPTDADVGCMLICTVLTTPNVDSAIEVCVGPVAGNTVEPEEAVDAYSEAEEPVAQNCSLEGDARSGQVLKGCVSYVCSIPEGRSVWRWFVVDPTGSEFQVPGTRSSCLTLTDEEVGDRIRFEYTPVTVHGIPGRPISATSGIVVPADYAGSEPPELEVQGHRVRLVPVRGSPIAPKQPREGDSPRGRTSIGLSAYVPLALQPTDPPSPPKPQAPAPQSPKQSPKQSPRAPPLAPEPAVPPPAETASGIPNADIDQPSASDVLDNCYLSLPTETCCMKVRKVQVPSELVSLGPLAYVWEVAPTGAGPWVAIGQQPTCQPTADHVNQLLRVRVAGGSRAPIASNTSYVLIDPGIHQQLLGVIAPGQAAINVRSGDGVPSEIIVNNEALRIKSKDHKVDIRWGQFQALVLAEGTDTEFCILQRPSAGAEAQPHRFRVDKRIDRDMVALMVRAYHGLASKEVAPALVGSSYARQWWSGAIRRLKTKVKEPGASKQMLVTALTSPAPHIPTHASAEPLHAAANVLAVLQRMASH
uniref:AMP-activated protein kinase glycogen-binding domain-containing protein n=1 Tax=Eutreptiella gymnastica TaxID=73025 RepID=A0A7S1NHV3_9EUGL|mmetsp:Transcript_40610/g.72688  ORF Transcript_40610/g.72688 Transcript_40610/m.72688 type:complete len:1556 (+) Transcript_40610:78-4745(+)